MIIVIVIVPIMAAMIAAVVPDTHIGEASDRKRRRGPPSGQW